MSKNINIKKLMKRQQIITKKKIKCLMFNYCDSSVDNKFQSNENMHELYALVITTSMCIITVII